jgi:hypothetical protein
MAHTTLRAQTQGRRQSPSHVIALGIPKVILRNEVLEVRNVDGVLRTTGSSMTEAVRRTLNNRERAALSRWRSKKGIYPRPVCLNDDQLDALEKRGYLHSDRRGDRADECDAIEMFLADSLAQSR